MSSFMPPIPASSTISLISLGPAGPVSERQKSEERLTFFMSPTRRISQKAPRQLSTSYFVPDSPNLSPISLSSSPSKLNLNEN